MATVGNWMGKTQGAGINAPCLAVGPAAEGQPWLGGWHWWPLTAAQLGYVPPRVGKRHTLMRLINQTMCWPPATPVSPAQQEKLLIPSNDGGHTNISAVAGAGEASARLQLWNCKAARLPVGLASCCVALRWGSWRRLVGDGGPGNGSGHPSRLRAALKSGERADWSGKTWRFCEVKPESQQQRLCDKVPLENLESHNHGALGLSGGRCLWQSFCFPLFSLNGL